MSQVYLKLFLFCFIQKHIYFLYFENEHKNKLWIGMLYIKGKKNNFFFN